MQFDAYDDYEQSERVQKWLRQNGPSIVIGVVIGLVAIFGYQKWRSHQQGRQMLAAELYQQAQFDLNTGQTGQADALIGQLQRDFPQSAYATFASSDRAVQLVDAGQLDKAQAPLDWALGHAPDPTLKALLAIRVARLQIARDKAQDALATLGQVPADIFQPMAQELRGDALVKLGHPDQARQAYLNAQAAQGKDGVQSGELQMKIDDLAETGKQGA